MPSILSIDDADESQVPALDSNAPVGSYLRILPIHACMTTAAYDDFNIIEDGVITEKWERVNGW
jgi:D-serine deaminase-like pyridoxal phosphate-dependent protein